MDHRNTTEIDLINSAIDVAKFKELLRENDFTWRDDPGEFRSSAGIPVHFLVAGEQAGKGSDVKIPEPLGEAIVEQRDGLPVVRL